MGKFMLLTLSRIGFSVFVLYAILLGCQFGAEKDVPGSRNDQPNAIVVLDWSTHQRKAPGSDNWPMTWSDDGHMYTHWGDGGGFGGSNSRNRVSFGIARIEGKHNQFKGKNLFGGDNAECTSNINGKSYGIISLKGVLYSWVSPGSGPRGYKEQRLYKSSDKGCTWTATDILFEKNFHGITGGNILNFGQDNAGARDQYVYNYFVDLVRDRQLRIQSPGNVFLSRVHADSLENMNAYRWYAGQDSMVFWGDFSRRQAVFHDPFGVSWSGASVIHIPGRDQYILTTEHTESFKGNIQMHIGPEPWGPWTEVLRETNWPSGGEVEHTTFYWNFAPMWFKNDGTEFTLIFTGIDSNDSWNSVEGKLNLDLLINN